MPGIYGRSIAGRSSEPAQRDTVSSRDGEGMGSVMFVFNEPYDPADNLPPADIREDFSGLTFEQGLDAQGVLDRLGVWLPADKLREFMDDLAMGRV